MERKESLVMGREWNDRTGYDGDRKGWDRMGLQINGKKGEERKKERGI